MGTKGTYICIDKGDYLKAGIAVMIIPATSMEDALMYLDKELRKQLVIPVEWGLSSKSGTLRLIYYNPDRDGYMEFSW